MDLIRDQSETMAGAAGVAADNVDATDTSAVSSSPIPGENERPRFVVLDAEYCTGDLGDGIRYSPGVWYFGSKPGRGNAPPTLTQQRISGPLHVDAVTFDRTGNNFGRWLRFKDTRGNWQRWAMPMEMLKGDGADVRGVLLSRGVYIDPSPAGRHLLAVYLQTLIPPRQVEAATQTGWTGDGFKAFALPDSVIGPHANRVTFQSHGLHTDEYIQKGTLPDWQAEVAAPAVGNPILVVSLCAAFAGPVLALVGAESGGIHLIGDSSTGKTTALQAACSVWGGESYRRSWRATANGLEGTAALFNDGLLALDEISECDSRDVGEVVYMLGNGRGKARASRTGTARTVARWRSSVLSTGERSIATSMFDAGQRVKAGQSVRLLDIPCQRKYGAWDALHNHSTGPAFSDAIKRASREQHGTAGREFLEKLTRQTENLAQRLEAIKAEMMNSASIPSGDGQPARAAARLAVLALAGELATTYGITGWPEGEATAAAKVAFAAWLEQRGGAGGNAEHGQVQDALRSFLERHGDSRFSDVQGNQYSGDDSVVRDRAGWWDADPLGIADGKAYLFTTDGIKAALRGFDMPRALEILRSTGVMEAPAKDGKPKLRKINGRPVRLYTVWPDKLD